MIDPGTSAASISCVYDKCEETTVHFFNILVNRNIVKIFAKIVYGYQYVGNGLSLS